MEKRAKYEDIKKLKRKAEKQKLKLKRLQAKETGDLMPIPRKLLIKTVAPVDFAAQSARVCIDVSFDDKMTEAEKRKTSKQLLRVYTLNRRAPKPMPVYFCGMKPDTQMYKIFEKNDGFQHWDVSKGIINSINTFLYSPSFHLQVKITPDTYLEEFPKEKIVYLTSDSENVLNELSQDDVYIIGGLVDHNRYKGLCQDNAELAGVRTARLPIKENVILKTRTVLTIEQGNW